MLKHDAVDVALFRQELFRREITMRQRAWLRATRMPLRSISFAASGATGSCRDPCTGSQQAAAELAASLEMLATSTRTLEVAHLRAVHAAGPPTVFQSETCLQSE